MKRKLMTILIAMLICSIMATACGKPETAPAGGEAPTAVETAPEAKPVEQKLVFAIHNEADTLDPGITNNSFASPYLCNTFEGLVTYDVKNSIIPGLAESWKISDDGLVYTFKLRSNLKWSDGSPLTSKDFEYAWKRVLDPKTGGQYADMLTSYIKNADGYYNGKKAFEDVGIKTPDDNTIEITLINATPYYLNILAMWVYSPVKEAVVSAYPDRWAKDAETFICNGPFKVSKISFGESIVLTKNEHYWNTGKVKLEEVTIRFIENKSTALAAFETGEIDGFRAIPPSDLPRLKAESDAFQVVPSCATSFYLINNTRKPLNNVKVRQALSMAVDRTDIIENVLQSSDKPAYGLVSPGCVFDGKDFNTGKTYGLAPTAKVEEARALLAEAGYPDGKGFPKLELSYYTDDTVKKVAEALQQMWKKNLNIDMEITTEEWKVYYDGVQKLDYDIAAMGWGADYLHPMTFLPLFETKNVANNSGYSNPEYDKLILAAQAEVDEAKSVEIMHQAEELLMSEMPVLNLYHRSNFLMMAPYVKGWNLNPLSNLYFSEAYIEK